MRQPDYFKPVNLERLEVDDEELDPIAQGVVTEDEVHDLFDLQGYSWNKVVFALSDTFNDSYHTHLRPVTLALDPVVCNPAFLRKTSPFLLTGICAVASNFLPAPAGNSGLTMRLFKHFNKVRHRARAT